MACYDRYDPSHVLKPERKYVRVWLGNMLARFAAVRRAGPSAVIAILPLDEASAAGLYTPYDGIVRFAPGLYVARASGARLKKITAANGTVRVRLSAQFDTFTGRNLVGVIPGRSAEVVILHSHTDGRVPKEKLRVPTRRPRCLTSSRDRCCRHTRQVFAPK